MHPLGSYIQAEIVQEDGILSILHPGVMML
jgi:hypothetical protein